MKLQRYLLKNQQRGCFFGEHFIESKYHYEWYFGEANIGISGNPSTEAELFIGGFLKTTDSLIIEDSKRFFAIYRSSSKTARISGSDAGEKETQDLISLIKRQEITHVYLSSSQQNGQFPGILTFSPHVPPEELYKPADLMKIQMQ